MFRMTNCPSAEEYISGDNLVMCIEEFVSGARISFTSQHLTLNCEYFQVLEDLMLCQDSFHIELFTCMQPILKDIRIIALLTIENNFSKTTRLQLYLNQI